MSIRPSRYFRLSITNQCTLKCYFCHNEGQDRDACTSNSLSSEDIKWVCKQMLQSGFTKFKLTGGEPTLRKDLPQIVTDLSELGIHDISIISNGTLLERTVDTLKTAGLHRINVSLYSLDPIRFKQNNGGSIQTLEAVKRGIEAALKSGYSDMKINYIYHGQEAIEDLKKVLEYVTNKGLVLVLLPLIPLNLKPEDEEISLIELYQLIKSWGIKEEKFITDAEGIQKRLITTTNNAKILLRTDKLRDNIPFKKCSQCENSAECKEGIFPLRMSSNGTIRPCLAGGLKSIPMREMIDARDSKRFLDIIQYIKNEGASDVSVY